MPITSLLSLQASIAAEMEAKARADEVLKKRAAETRLLEDERGAIKREVRTCCGS